MCGIHLRAAGAVVSSIVRGVFGPRGRVNCVHQFFCGDVSCRVPNWAHAGLGTAGFWSVLALPRRIFALSAPMCAAGSWLAQHVLAQSVFSHRFLNAQQALGRRSAPAVQ